MRRLFFLIFFPLRLFAQTDEIFTIHSFFVKDSFSVTVRRPPGYVNEQSYHVIFVADGSLKLGNYILGKDKSWAAVIPGNCVVVTIAHFGNWHEKRQRDFIPSDKDGYSDKEFGQAKNFYYFLKNEVMVRINRKIPNQKSRSFIGHSFSGLFCLYTLFQKDKLFDHHFAISPSVWANDEALLKIENEFYKTGNPVSGDINIRAGGLEIFNRVLSSTRVFIQQVSSRKYERCSISFSTINNANHFSIIKPAVDKILASFKD